MEQINSKMQEVSRQTSVESRTHAELSTNFQPKPSLAVSREKFNAMLNVLNKRWLTKGWRVMDPDDSKIMALAWIENLDEHHIPYRHYEELYRRSIGLRAQRLNEGLECDDFSVDMLIACWPGLSHEIQRRDIEAGRTLPDTAASDCPRCFGVGMETLPDPDNPRYRTARLCDHACPQGNQAAVGLTLERDPNQRRVMVQCESCEELHEIDLSRCNNGGEGR